jgi:hypothetical protein
MPVGVVVEQTPGVALLVAFEPDRAPERDDLPDGVRAAPGELPGVDAVDGDDGGQARLIGRRASRRSEAWTGCAVGPAPR